MRPGQYRIPRAERTVIQLRTVIAEHMLRNDFRNGLRVIPGSARAPGELFQIQGCGTAER